MTAWIEEEWNRPDRSDHYLMSLSQLLGQIVELVVFLPGALYGGKWPPDLKRGGLDGQKITFKVQTKRTKEQEDADLIERHKKDQDILKALWGGYLQGTKPQRWSEATKKE